MGTRRDYRGPEEAFDAYDAAIQRVADVVRRGAANPYTSGNGRMASFLGKEGEVAVRLGGDELREFLATHDTDHPVSYGATMRDFALVPPALVADPDALAEVLRRAHAHVASLPPT